MSIFNKEIPWKTLHWVLSPVLAFGIYLSIINLGSTYNLVENYQRESIWSLVHLNTQLNSAQYDMQLYSHGQLTERALRTRYELIWSKFPVLLSNLKKDDMLKQVDGLQDLIEKTFDKVKAMEADIYSSNIVNTELLPQWVTTINHAHEAIQRYLLHEITDADGSYSKASWNKLLSALYFVAGLSLLFFIHLGYLIISLAKERAESHFQLSHDALTGLASRNNTMQVLEDCCKANKPFTLAILDLDRFKQVNDNYGHQAGDHVLKHLSEAFRATLGNYGLMGRLGGDEFAWIIHETDPELLNRYYLELTNELETPCMHDQTEFFIKLSAGASINHGNKPYSKTTMLAWADQAMYTAKKSDSDTIVWHPPRPQQQSTTSSKLISLLF